MEIKEIIPQQTWVIFKLTFKFFLLHQQLQKKAAAGGTATKGADSKTETPKAATKGGKKGQEYYNLQKNVNINHY